MQIEFVTSRKLRDENCLEAVCKSLAGLHVTGVPNDLMTLLGVDFLETLFYRGLLDSPHAVVVTIMDGETVAAYAAVALDMDRCLREIVISSPLRSVWFGFSRVLLQPKLWLPFIGAMRLDAPEHLKSASEILMISTADAYRGKGLGVKLLSTIDEDLRKRGVEACLARVREDNLHAMRMYKGNGYYEVNSVIFNGSKWKWLVRDLSQI